MFNYHLKTLVVCLSKNDTRLSLMNRQTDHLDCLDHGSAQHSVVDLCPPPAGYDTPLSCLKRNAKINQRIQKLTMVVILSSLTLLCMHNFSQSWNYRAVVCWRTCPVCSTACSGRWWAEGFSVWHNSLPYPAGILQVHIQRKYTQVHTENKDHTDTHRKQKISMWLQMYFILYYAAFKSRPLQKRY